MTLLVVAAFGIVRLVGGGGDATTSATDGTDVTAVVDHSLYVAGGALGQGVGLRNLHDQYLVRDAIDRSIAAVYVDRMTLADTARGATGDRGAALDAAVGAEDRLLEALTRWRDAVFNLRFAQVGPAETAVTDAMGALTAARDAWNAAGSSP